MFVTVSKGERPPIRWHANNQFALGYSPFHPSFSSNTDGLLCPQPRVRGGGVERGIVSSLVLPFAMKIKGHQVHKVEPFDNTGHIIAVMYIFRPNRNGS